MRIEDAVREAERANANRDERAYNRARHKYEQADAWLTKLEQERNMTAIEELEAKARNGELGYSTILRAGVPFEKLKARGWLDMPNKAGMWKPAQSDGQDASEQAGKVERNDDTADADREDAEHDSSGERAEHEAECKAPPHQ